MPPPPPVHPPLPTHPPPPRGGGRGGRGGRGRGNSNRCDGGTTDQGPIDEKQTGSSSATRGEGERAERIKGAALVDSGKGQQGNQQGKGRGGRGGGNGGSRGGGRGSDDPKSSRGVEEATAQMGVLKLERAGPPDPATMDATHASRLALSGRTAEVRVATKLGAEEAAEHAAAGGAPPRGATCAAPTPPAQLSWAAKLAGDRGGDTTGGVAATGAAAARAPPPLTTASPHMTPAAALEAVEASRRAMSQLTLEGMYRLRMLDAPGERPPQPPQTFELYESVRGKRINTLAGLALHRDILSPAEQAHTLAYVRRLAKLGDEGALCGRTYSAPRKWMRGKGRVTVQMGCCYNYGTNPRPQSTQGAPRKP